MARDLESLIISLSLNTGGLEKALKRTRRDLNAWSRDLTAAGRTLTASITVPLAAAGGAALKLGADFESNFAKIEGLVGVSREELDKWQRQVLELGPRVARSPRELSEALFDVASAGFRGTEAMDILEKAGMAAAAGLGETRQIAGTLTSALLAYESQGVTAAQATNVIVGAVRLGKLEAESFAPALKQVSGIAASMRVPIEEVGGALAAMSLTMKSSESAGAALTGILIAIQKEEKGASDELLKAGTSFGELRKQIVEKGLDRALIDLRRTLKENGIELAKVFRDSQALQGVLALTGDTAGKTTAIMKEMRSGTDFLTEAFRAQQETINFKWAAAVSEAETILIDVGDVLKKDLVVVLEAATKLLKSAARAWLDLDADTKQSVMRIAAAIGVGGPLLLALGAVAGGLANMITLALRLKVIFAGLALAGSGPFALVAIALGALATAWATDFGGMRTTLEGWERTITDTLRSVRDKLLAHAAEFAGFTADPELTKRRDIHKAIGAHQALIAGRPRPATAAEIAGIDPSKLRVITIDANEARNATRALGDEILRIEPATWQIADAWSASSQEIIRVTDEVKNSQLHNYVLIDSFLQQMLDRNMQRWSSFAEFIGGTFAQSITAGFQTMATAGKGVWDGVVAGAKNFVIRMLDMMEQALIGQQAAAIAMSVASAPFTFGSSLFAIPRILASVGPAVIALELAKAGIAGLAQGGRILSAGAALVGELGPELVRLPRGAMVEPLAAGAGGGTMTLQILIDGRNVAEAMLPWMPGLVRVNTGGRR